jgi:hypothetical protein
MLSLNNTSFAYKHFDCTEFMNILRYPKIQSFLKEFIDASIATSELNILKRITAIEEKLGIVENESPTIESRLAKIEAKVNSPTYETRPLVEPEIQPSTVTEERAIELVEELKTSDKGYLSTREVIRFLKQKVPHAKNIWKVKKDVLATAQEMFPNTIALNKRDRGRHEVRLILAS